MRDGEEQHPVPGDQDGYGQRERRFRRLYDEHYGAVQAYAARRLDDGIEVADVLAEVFTIAWRRLADIPPPPADRLWLYGVARRVLAAQHRGAKRFRRLIGRIGAAGTAAPVEGPPGEAGGSAGEVLLDLLRQLPDREREALRLVFWEQLSHAEAARVLGCSANAVAIRVHRAKTRLRAALTRAETVVPLSSSSGRR